MLDKEFNQRLVTIVVVLVFADKFFVAVINFQHSLYFYNSNTGELNLFEKMSDHYSNFYYCLDIDLYPDVLILTKSVLKLLLWK